MGNIYVVGPNEALIISGGCCGGSTDKKMIVGDWAWAWWAVSDVQLLSLEIFSLKPKCENVETAQGVAIFVTGVAQCKIKAQQEYLKNAAEQFLGMTIKQIKTVLLETLEGHLRAILGTLSVEQIYQDRDSFARSVREMATPDIRQMGIEIISFTIKDIHDSVGYLASLGRARVAQIKRDAQTGVIQADRDAGIQESQCEKESLDVQFETKARIENAKRSYQMQQAQFDREINTIQAEKELAFELQSTKVQQRIKNEHKKVELIKKQKMIELQRLDIELREKLLDADVRLPIDSESYKILTETEGKKNASVMLAEADGAKIRIIGEAEARKEKIIGLGDANALKLRAQALNQYNDAAVLALMLEAMPLVTKEITRPLSKISEIVITSSSEQDSLVDVTSGLLAKLPPITKALSGVDLKQYLAGKINPDQI